ncbi:MAG: twin-arginine translocase subunit TatC [Clostridia bacterium]|nr:twin-arginine translocase subunit TatC [Clostridia bacterium]
MNEKNKKQTDRKAEAGRETDQKPEQVAPAEGGAPLLTHLLALRRVLVISAAAVAIAFFLVYYLAIDTLMSWITGPIVERGIEIIYTAMSEALVTKFKVALIAAVIVASPVIIGQIWGFIKPALYPKEKKAFRILFFVALFLFLLGVVFCYVAVYLLAVDFFLVAGDNLATPMLSIDKYVSFLFGFIVPFGVAFQLPVFLYLTTRMGWTNAKMLAEKRKFVILGVFVFAAILTPPDVVSQVALGVPMMLLYEVGILVCRLTKPRERE